MVDETPRLGLNKYEPGDTDWDHSDTVDAVDEHAIEHGPVDERPAEGEYDDELYHATDQDIIWRWDAAEEDWTYFSGQGSAARPVPGTSRYEAVRTAQANRTVYAPPGGVQRRIDEAAAALTGDETARVKLLPSTTYDEGEELHIKEGVVLDCNGALIAPSSDHDVFFCDRRTGLLSPRVDVREISFTSTVLTLDTARAGGQYHLMDNTQVVVEDAVFLASHRQMTGTAISITADGDNISALNRFSASVYGFEYGFDIHVEDAHANSNTFELNIWRSRVAIRHTGGANDPFESTIYGELQPSSLGPGSDHLILNESGCARCHRFVGRVWDTHYLNDGGEALVGPVNLHMNVSPDQLIADSPNAKGVLVTQRRDGVTYTDLEDGTTYRESFSSQWRQFSYYEDDETPTRYLDHRPAGDHMRVDLREETELTGYPHFTSVTAATCNSIYWDPAVEALKYRDPDGNEHVLTNGS